jgi:predicted permease
MRPVPLRRFLTWLRRRRLDAQAREELQLHIDLRRQSLIDDGMDPAAADAEARRLFGNMTRYREELHEMWGLPMVDTVLQDVQYGLRLLMRAPGFASVAVVSLGVGIGAATAVFTLADATLFQKLAVKNPDRLVVVKWVSGLAAPFTSLNGTGSQTRDGLSSTSFSAAAFREMRLRAAPFADFFGFADLYDVSVSIDGRAEAANAHAVSGEYFRVLGVSAALGRTLGPSDDAASAPPVAVVSHRLWMRRLNRAPDAIGRPVVVNGVAFSIVGVAPAAFQGTGQVGDAPDVFVPLSAKRTVVPHDDPPEDPGFWWVLVMGRLHDDASAAALEPVLDGVLTQTVMAVRPKIAAGDLPHVVLRSGAKGQVEAREGLHEPLRNMAIVIGIVLLVACANVANLLLARGRARTRELSVRIAIGASRRRIVRQLVTEGLLIAGFGAVLGVLSAGWIAAALLPALSSSDALTTTAQPDVRALAFTVLLAATCAVLFSVAPALRSTQGPVRWGLQEPGRGISTARGQTRLAAALVIGQIALSMTLVSAAALLVRSVRSMESVQPGFNPRGVLLFRLDPALNGYEEPAVRQLYATILERLRALPGVRGATLTSHTLLANSSVMAAATQPGERLPERRSAEAPAFIESHAALHLGVDAAFFKVMELPIVRGATFTESDALGPERVVVINRLLALQLFGTEDAVGRSVRLGLQASSPQYRVIGIAADALYPSIRRSFMPTAYIPFWQQHARTATFEVRAGGDPHAFANSAREIVRALDPNLPLLAVRSQEDQIALSLRQERLFARLAALLGLVTLVLSAVGLYGLMAYSVTQRTPEIGVRMALGANRSAVRWMVLRRSLVLAGAGLVAGAACVFASGRLLDALLYGIAARDPVTLTSAAVMMLAVSSLAAYLPARRASRVDPIMVLRM